MRPFKRVTTTPDAGFAGDTTATYRHGVLLFGRRRAIMLEP
jgi:hypothetical protein